ncbi:MAG: hypothetical protein ACKVQR_06065, partial [Aquabacterium sp.]
MRRFLRLLPAAGAACLIACSDGGQGRSTQVVAQVDDSEISVHQINHLLRRQPGLDASSAETAARGAL